MNDIQLQQLIEALPDQQLAMLAQGSSPNVRPELALMEMQRRESRRKSSALGSKRFAEGGLVSLDAFKRPRPNEYFPGAEALIDEIGGITSQGLQEDRARREADKARTERMIDEVVDITRRGMQEGRSAPAGIQSLTNTPALPSPLPLPLPSTPTPTPTPTPTGINSLRTAANSVSSTPANGRAQPGGGAPSAEKLLQAADIQATTLLKQYKEMEQLLKDRQADFATDVTTDNKQAVYKAIGQIGMQLLLGESVARSGAAGAALLQKELESNKDKRDRAKQQAFELGLQAMEVKAKADGVPFDKEKLKYDIGVGQREEVRKDRELDIRAQSNVADTALKKAQIDTQKAMADKYRAEARGGASGLKVTPNDVEQKIPLAMVALQDKGVLNPTEAQVMQEAGNMALLDAMTAQRAQQQGIMGGPLSSPAPNLGAGVWGPVSVSQ